MAVYLVSGGDDVAPAVVGLQARGRHVLHDDAVHDDAHHTLHHTAELGSHFVVVAHGRADGTVRWYKTARATAEDWLWVGMPNPPQNVRIYLYCCHVGKHLPGLLANCEAFGHVDSVPIPNGVDDALILDFLDQVEELVHEEIFDREEWRTRLIAYVEAAFAAEVEQPSSLLGAPTLFLLLRSLGYQGG